MFCRSLSVLSLLVIVLSVLRFKDSDYLPLVSSNSSSELELLPLSRILYYIIYYIIYYIGRRGRDRMVVGFTAYCANQCLSPLKL
jgi:hypothetical protein